MEKTVQLGESFELAEVQFVSEDNIIGGRLTGIDFIGILRETYEGRE